MKQCPRCSSPVGPTDRFCGACAAPIPKVPEAVAPQVAAPVAISSVGGQPGPNYLTEPAAPPLQRPPFGAPPPGVDARGQYSPSYQQGVSPAAGPYSPPPAPAASNPASPYSPPMSPLEQRTTSAHCDHGHDIRVGSSYCDFGHPIALGDMKFAGGEAFGPTAYPPEPKPDPGQQPLPPTGAMSPFPQPAPPPNVGLVAAPVAAFAAQPQVTPPAPGQLPPVQPPAQWPAAAEIPLPADPFGTTAPQTSGRRSLRGFLYSFHTDSNGTHWTLFAGRNLVGRAGAGEIVEIEIADPTTSSRHATIVCEGSSTMLEDDGSTNGTFVNDQPLGYRGKAELHDGDRIRFGAYNAIVRLISR